MVELKWNKDFAFEQSGEDAELLSELLSLLVSSSSADLLKIKEGMAAGELDKVADAAHSIKGAAASLGVEGLRDIAHMFEKQGRLGDLSGLDIKELDEMIKELSSLSA